MKWYYFFYFTYPLRYLRVPPGVRVPQVEYHWCRGFMQNRVLRVSVNVMTCLQLATGLSLHTGLCSRMQDANVLWLYFGVGQKKGKRKMSVGSYAVTELHWSVIAPFTVKLGAGLDDGGVGVRVSVGSRIFSTSSRPVLGPTQPPVQWIPGLFPRG
jgi:hypothetical protein